MRKKTLRKKCQMKSSKKVASAIGFSSDNGRDRLHRPNNQPEESLHVNAHCISIGVNVTALPAQWREYIKLWMERTGAHRLAKLLYGHSGKTMNSQTGVII